MKRQHKIEREAPKGYRIPEHIPETPRFRLIALDAPWDKHQTGKLGAANHYDLMSYERIRDLPISDLAHANAQFVSSKDRIPVTVARKIRVSRPVLTLNHERTSAMVRATIAAMISGTIGTETVLQIVLGRSYSPSTATNNGKSQKEPSNE